MRKLPTSEINLIVWIIKLSPKLFRPSGALRNLYLQNIIMKVVNGLNYLSNFTWKKIDGKEYYV